MSDKPKRRFWQLHLSTAVLLMLSLSGFVGLNAIPFADEYLEFVQAGHILRQEKNIAYVYGWPRAFLWRDARRSRVHFIPISSDDARELWPDCGLQYAFVCALPNLCACLAGHFLIAFACEWYIRRREGRKS